MAPIRQLGLLRSSFRASQTTEATRRKLHSPPRAGSPTFHSKLDAFLAESRIHWLVSELYGQVAKIQELEQCGMRAKMKRSVILNIWASSPTSELESIQYNNSGYALSRSLCIRDGAARLARTGYTHISGSYNTCTECPNIPTRCSGSRDHAFTALNSLVVVIRMIHIH